MLHISIKISLVISASKILTDLCAIKQKVTIKNTFADIAYNVLVVKKLLKKCNRYIY